MSEPLENSLSKAASAYLRSARHQPIAWHEWGTEAFEKARREDKPVLLDIGAVWCHWCHVMDRESYENPETAALINEHFIAVKVDRDERPDVDARYQSAVAAISGQGGWPLTAFLTPDGKPYFGGTYFPPDDRYGRPGLRRVLAMMAEAFYDRRDEVLETADSVIAALEHNEAFDGRAENPGPDIIGKLLDSMLRQHDARNGGFGSQPKFPHSAAIDLLIDAAGRGGEAAETCANAAKLTLRKMAAGGIYDHLAGGFHRYSVDERWIVPHFEKMAYDNSELLKNYVHAYSTFGDQDFAAVARDIVRWMDEWLSDRELGGFYASQDADDSLEDDGDYFTWTRAEAAAVLTPEEFRVAELRFNLRPVGDMHHNPAKNVLHLGADAAEIARAFQLDESQARERIAAVAAKLYAARKQRRTPYVDRTVYTGWNGMCLSAYFAASAALGNEDIRSFALKSLDRILAAAWNETTGLGHVVAYGEGVIPGARVAGTLEDYAFLATAALDAWEATGELRYFTVAQSLADAMLDRFYDKQGGAFFDIEASPEAIGVLATRRKPLQDSPSPSGNSVAAAVMLRLAALVDDASRYQRAAQQTLENFAAVVEHFGLYAASYGLALRRAAEGPTQICVFGSQKLATAALHPFAANKSVVNLSSLKGLPPALAETIPRVPGIAEGTAIVCRGNVCLPPVDTVEKLREALAHG